MKMVPLCNQLRRARLERAEAQLKLAALAVVASPDGTKNDVADRKLLRIGKTVLKARLSYLKARRWVLLEEPNQKHEKTLTAIAQEEDQLVREGVTLIVQDALKIAKSTKI